ncbi:Rieske (2Fe-2S) protein [Streptomyces sp. NBC_00239]|uniref:Rieske (2Fe-2S) protein n=1 Tax=Streptomyces sp. NBC_00239 TaxID=2903640 RepID=UPI002E2A83F9|nr:Rieske (2Fe-2S) protein [Streptomyces sp. NBC_00239]
MSETLPLPSAGRPSPRRTVLAAGAAALAGGALVGCGEDKGTDTGSGTVTEPGAATGSVPAAAPSSNGTAPPKGAGALVKTADVPVGGGTVIKDQKVVVTQPTAGEFKAFSAVCTHQGCLVNKVADGTIDCPCHGSKFAVADAKVVNGPATRPLPEKKITVADGEVRLA